MENESPHATTTNLRKERWMPLRHALLADAVKDTHTTFTHIQKAFKPQTVHYSNTAYAKNHWHISCFMQYKQGVAATKIDLERAEPLRAVCEPLMRQCDQLFLRWYAEAHPCAHGSERSLERLQSFVTRYLPRADETHLPRHIDGANVDGSLVLGLPTEAPFGGGGLTVWDGEGEEEVFEYPVRAGDVCVLDKGVWHQSNPIESGERWVIVIFYKVVDERVGRTSESLAAASAESRKSHARGQLSRLILEAKRQRERASRVPVSQSSAE